MKENEENIEKTEIVETVKTEQKKLKNQKATIIKKNQRKIKKDLKKH